MSTYFLRGHLSPTLGALPWSEPDAYDQLGATACSFPADRPSVVRR